MLNDRIYDALVYLFPTADPKTAWKIEQGPHTNGEIKIVSWGLETPMPTQSELDAVYHLIAKADRRAEILVLLEKIDAQSVRPLRAKLSGSTSAEDDRILAELEADAVALRAEFATLG